MPVMASMTLPVITTGSFGLISNVGAPNVFGTPFTIVIISSSGGTIEEVCASGADGLLYWKLVALASLRTTGASSSDTLDMRSVSVMLGTAVPAIEFDVVASSVDLLAIRDVHVASRVAK